MLILNTYRYAEIEKKGQLLSTEDLEKAIHNLQKEYEGLCVPGDKEAVEDVKLDISMQKERLNMLEKQEDALNEMLKQNKWVVSYIFIKKQLFESKAEKYMAMVWLYPSHAYFSFMKM